jgi:hypothetical protein
MSVMPKLSLFDQKEVTELLLESMTPQNRVSELGLGKPAGSFLDKAN